MTKADSKIKQLQRIIDSSSNIVFLGGAGVSTESGIPDFRSSSGLYNEATDRHLTPEYIVSHSYFMSHTSEFFKYYFSKMVHKDAIPNATHKKLAELEKTGKLSAIITQNIDGLHEKAGSNNVIDIHGTIYENHCTKCNTSYTLEELMKLMQIRKKPIPICPECGSVIKPNVVLYGENLDPDKLDRAQQALAKADTLIIGGTSLLVQPAASLVFSFKGQNIVLINHTPTPLDYMAKLIINDNVGDVFSKIKVRTKKQPLSEVISRYISHTKDNDNKSM